MLVTSIIVIFKTSNYFLIHKVILMGIWISILVTISWGRKFYLNLQTRKGAEDLFSKAAQDHIDVTAYTKPMVHLDELAYTVGTSINLCVDQNLENALQYFKSILTNLNRTIDYAVALQEEARHCFDNVYSPASLAKATFCGKKVSW